MGKDLKEIMQKMTPKLWSALEKLESGDVSHNFRRGTPIDGYWDQYITLETLALATWRETGSYQEWEEYSINDNGHELLRLYREQQDKDA